MKVLQGYRYSVTANEEVTVTDENGLNLTCPAGQQTYFTATCDEVEVSGDAVVTQARGHITIGGGGGGGEKIAPGEVVLGGAQGSITITDLNTMSLSPVFLKSELPEGVTLANLITSLIGGATNAQYASLLFGTSGSSPYVYGSILSKYPGRRLPSTLNLAKLEYAAFTFARSELEEVTLSLPALYNQQQGMFIYCYNLVRAEVDTPIMTLGTTMFMGCSSLSHFRGDLSALTGGNGMFTSCKLDLESVQHIASSINNVTSVSGSHPITIGVDSNKVTQSQQDSANAILVGKGWTVTWQRN